MKSFLTRTNYKQDLITFFFLKKKSDLEYLMSSEGGSKILQIVGAYLANDTVLYSKQVNLYQHG